MTTFVTSVKVWSVIPSVTLTGTSAWPGPSFQTTAPSARPAREGAFFPFSASAAFSTAEAPSSIPALAYSYLMVSRGYGGRYRIAAFGSFTTFGTVATGIVT